MELDLSQVQYSRKDLAKKIIIPRELTEELAEDVGSHIGDGSLYRTGQYKTFEMCYSQHVDEMEYQQKTIEMKRRLYNLQKFRSYIRGNEITFRLNSLAIATFYSRVMGLPIGKKKNIDVPEIIKSCEDQKIISAFLRGMIDTDFGLIVRKKQGRFYPTLEGSSISHNLIISLQKLFSKLGIASRIELGETRYHKKAHKYYTINKIYIRKRDDLVKCLKTIKPHNRKYSKKIENMGLWGFEFWV